VFLWKLKNRPRDQPPWPGSRGGRVIRCSVSWLILRSASNKGSAALASTPWIPACPPLPRFGSAPTIGQKPGSQATAPPQADSPRDGEDARLGPPGSS